jgi:hypothetical protein
MRVKVTALIFSKDDTEQAVELAKAIHDDFDETVIMDASGKRDKRYLKEQKQKLNLSNAKIFDVIALGFREPLMMYAVTKCRNEWVIVLNTDEVPSKDLVRDMPMLMKRKGCDAYSVPIYSVHGPTSRTFVSSQIRFFKKSKIEFRGMLHEQPLVHGKFVELTKSKYYVNHSTAGKIHTTGGGYAEMERFQRYTYDQYNRNMLEMYDRARRVYSLEKKSQLSPIKRLVYSSLRLYQTLGLKSQDQEVSNFDYFLSTLARDIAHQIRRRRPKGVIEAFPNAAKYAGKMGTWRKSDTGKEDFDIANEIRDIGTIRYLGLNRVDVVEKLNRKYLSRESEQGIGLLIQLLRRKHRKQSIV